MTTAFVEAAHPRAKSGKFEDKAQGAPEVSLKVGPSEIIRGQSVGYSVTESRMSQAFIAVEDREAFAEAKAAEGVAEGRPADEYRSSTPAYWMRQFEAYDIFEAEAPAEFNQDQQDGFNSVSLEKLNLDLDHQPRSYNIFSVSKNEDLARNTDGLYRNHANPAMRTRMNDFWDARADRLTSVREQLEAIEAAEKAS
jgi:hypothetical protein